MVVTAPSLPCGAAHDSLLSLSQTVALMIERHDLGSPVLLE
jgi:hypothetical protein